MRSHPQSYLALETGSDPVLEATRRKYVISDNFRPWILRPAVAPTQPGTTGGF